MKILGIRNYIMLLLCLKQFFSLTQLHHLFIFTAHCIIPVNSFLFVTISSDFHFVNFQKQYYPFANSSFCHCFSRYLKFEKALRWRVIIIKSPFHSLHRSPSNFSASSVCVFAKLWIPDDFLYSNFTDKRIFLPTRT